MPRVRKKVNSPDQMPKTAHKPSEPSGDLASPQNRCTSISESRQAIAAQIEQTEKVSET
jgi:hypothetical protein